MRQLLRERTAEKWSHLDAETRKRHLETIAQYILDERGQVGSFVDMWIKTTFEGGSEAVAHGAQWAALGCRLMLLACRQPASKFPHIAPYRWRADTAPGLADERLTSSDWKDTSTRINVEFVMLAKELAAEDAGLADAGLGPLPSEFLRLVKRVADCASCFRAFKECKNADAWARAMVAFEAFMAHDLVVEVSKVESLCLMYSKALCKILGQLHGILLGNDIPGHHAVDGVATMDRIEMVAQVLLSVLACPIGAV
jgi:hypothetical protein